MHFAADIEADPVARIVLNPHLPCPETRSRVVGYLRHASEPAPGYRTDGVWVWPAVLADRAAALGVGPRADLLEHLERREYLLPESVSDQTLSDAAARVCGPVTRSSPDDVTYLVDPASRHAPVIRRFAGPADQNVVQAFTRSGWRRMDVGMTSNGYEQTVAINVPARLDELCASWHATRLSGARESSEPDRGLRLARMFDGVAPSGVPWFSPSRLRITEAQRRDRLAAYLSGGRLVVRSTSGMADPLSPGSHEAVPLGYRTDGVWVWQEGLGYYVRSRGAAPELAFLNHIEERAYHLGPPVTTEQVRAAVDVVRRGPLPPPDRPTFRYYADSQVTTLVRRVREHRSDAEYLGADLRWVLRTSTEDGMDAITEADAVRLTDSRWAALAGAVG